MNCSHDATLSVVTDNEGLTCNNAASTSTIIRKRRTVKVALAVGGAMNPIHLGHCNLLSASVKLFASFSHHVYLPASPSSSSTQKVEYIISYEVVGAYFAAAPDGYVKNKFKNHRHRNLVMEGKHRVNMCNLAVDELKETTTALQKSSSTFGSAADCIKKMTNRGDAIHSVIIVGADRAVNNKGQAKWLRKPKRPTTTTTTTTTVARADDALLRLEDCYIRMVAVARGEQTTIAALLREQTTAYEQTLSFSVPHAYTTHLGCNGFLFVESDLYPLSSTEVRDFICEQLQQNVDISTIVDDIVKKNWMPKSVAKYMLENGLLNST